MEPARTHVSTLGTERNDRKSTHFVSEHEPLTESNLPCVKGNIEYTR